MIYHRMTENLLWKCQSLKSVCAEQCVDFDGVRSAIRAVVHLAARWNVHVERRKIRVG